MEPEQWKNHDETMKNFRTIKKPVGPQNFSYRMCPSYAPQTKPHLFELMLAFWSKPYELTKIINCYFEYIEVLNEQK